MPEPAANGAPDISVVLATYDRRRSLPRAIASVLAQQGARFELIIVDDASRDDTLAYLATLEDPRIRVLASERNHGPSAARNRGLAAARGELVAFLNSDDAYRPGRLAAPLASFAADRGLVATLSSAVKHDRSGARDALIPAVKLAAPAFEWALISDRAGRGDQHHGAAEKALAAGGFCESLRLTEDREFLIRLEAGRRRAAAGIAVEEFSGDDNLSNDWASAGQGLAAYVRERPEYAGRFRKVGSYLATKVLVADLRLGLWGALCRDLRALHAAGLLGADPVRLIRDHREVHRYRRTMSGGPALARLTGPPASWN